jgi:hypothetical protein
MALRSPSLRPAFLAGEDVFVVSQWMYDYESRLAAHTDVSHRKGCMPIYLTHIAQPKKGAIMLQHCPDCRSTQILVNEYAAKPEEGDAWVIEQCCVSHRKLHQPLELRRAKAYFRMPEAA